MPDIPFGKGLHATIRRFAADLRSYVTFEFCR
jgi:hypothetical protein